MFEAEGYEVVAINDLTSPKMLAHLLKYDTAQGGFCGKFGENKHTVEAGDDLTIERELKYDLSEMATVNVELDFDPESSVTDAEAPEIDVYVRRYKTGKLVASAELTYENGRAATFYLKPGEYRISFGYNYEMDGHIVNAIEDATLTVEAGETYNISRTVKYFAAETPATAP
jgi:hypothetical protein